MQFHELCRRSKSVRITVALREGNKVTYFPEEFDLKRGLGRETLDLSALTWLTNPICSDFKNYYVTNIEPTAHNYMTVTLVKNGVETKEKCHTQPTCI